MKEVAIDHADISLQDLFRQRISKVSISSDSSRPSDAGGRIDANCRLTGGADIMPSRERTRRLNRKYESQKRAKFKINK
jgi:hypothetical protein